MACQVNPQNAAAATRVWLEQGEISRIANGKRKPKEIRLFEAVADGLEMPDFARIDWCPAPTTVPGELDHSDGASKEDDELLDHIARSRSVDSALIAVLRDQTDNIRLLSRLLGGSASADQVRAHIHQVEGSLRHSLRLGLREPLAAVLADASALAGGRRSTCDATRGVGPFRARQVSRA